MNYPEYSLSRATPESVTAARMRDPELEANADYDMPFIAMEGAGNVLEPLHIEYMMEKKRALVGRFVARLLRNVDAPCAADAPEDLKELAGSIRENADQIEHPDVRERLAQVALQKREEVLTLCRRVYEEIRWKQTPETLTDALDELENLHARLLTF